MLRDDADFDRADLTLVEAVVGAIVAEGAVDVDTLMLVGAHCRDVWAQALAHPEPLRRTNDLDLGIAVQEMAAYEAVTTHFRPWPDSGNGIAYSVAGLAVDLMPFGEAVERPPGQVSPRRRHGEPFSVFAFEDVYATSVVLPLRDDLAPRIPTPEGFTVLKIAAWHDRREQETKDAADLATVLRWYSMSERIRDEVYDETNSEILSFAGFDPSVAAAVLWGIRTRETLSVPVMAELTELWNASKETLPRHMHRSGQVGHDPDLVREQLIGFEDGLLGRL